MTIQSESNNAFSEAQNDAMLTLPPVKNTFYHFDTSSLVPPAGPSELLRLQTCPAELGMSYFFEKIGRAPPPCAPAVGSRCPPPPTALLPAAKSVRWADNDDCLAEEERQPAGSVNEETVTTGAEKETTQLPADEDEQAQLSVEEKTQRGEKQNEEDDALGEFFAVKSAKKKLRRCTGRTSSQEVWQMTMKTEEEAALPATAAEEQKPAAEELKKQITAPADGDESFESFPAIAREEGEKQGLSKEQPAQASAAPGQQRPRWADLEESEGKDQDGVPPPLPARPRWAEIEEDDSPMPAPVPAREEAEQQRRPQRPVFGRPGREVRVRQARIDAEEICSLEFDAVDASSQMGLVGRMIVMLKSLAQVVVFWEGEEKREEEKFRLLGLEEDDMYAIGKRIRRAGKKIDQRNFRDSFDQMCEARRWLRDPEWAVAERAQRGEKAAAREAEPTAESKRKKKSTVAEEEPVVAVTEDAGEEEWQVVRGAGAEKKKKKTRQEVEKIQQVATAARGNTAQAKKQSSAPLAKAEQPPVSQPAARGGRASWSSSSSSGTQQRPAVAQAPAIVVPCRSVGGAPRQGTIAGTKFLCRFTVGIEPEVKGGFRVCRKIFGPGGENMKSIALGTNAKLRLRGRGSGFKEGPELREAAEPLVLCLSTEDPEGYRKAVVQVTELFERIYAEYQAHCRRHGLPEAESRLAVQLQEHPGNPRG